MRAVVTGGGAGIGLAVAQRLLSEGWHVAVVYRRHPGGAHRLGAVARRRRCNLVLVAADLRDEAQTERAFRVIRRRLGKVDAVIANAGDFPGRFPLRRMSLEQWRAAIDANLTATFLTCRAAVPHLRPGGQIVAIASRAALDGGGPGAAAYAAAKAGIVALCLSLAKELRPLGIAATALTPGPVDTDLYRRNAAKVATGPAPEAAADIAKLVWDSLVFGSVERLARR
jgi:3-oxoacyl-[acyl-carrier protein] reductase